MNRIEILAPAGGMDSVIAAVRAGADAVYVGLKEFSARAHAKNFDEDELCECVQYCHIRGVKVYVAMNTILFDEEMDSAIALVRAIARADADAVIVQDMGLYDLIRRAVPGMRLHASTQMSVHTPYGARALWELGFRRVVLARELSLTEIAAIHAEVPQMELEVFVHGALCMCVSGQCYFSAMLGGRSANRGMCAQPCRLPISFGGSDHALSLKDNGAVEWISELAACGVTSAKIEGRMKRPEYVATAVRACRQQRDDGVIDDDTRRWMRAVFSRSGFTDGYLGGELGTEMFGTRMKEDVLSADGKLLREIRASYKEERRIIAIDMRLAVSVGKRATLCVTDGVHTVTAQSDEPAAQAEHLPLTAAQATVSLQKTGGTPYTVNSIKCEIEDQVSVPVSVLNRLRRDALEELSRTRSWVHDYVTEDIDLSLPDEHRRTHGRYAVVPTSALTESMQSFEIVFIDLFALTAEQATRLRDDGYRIGVEIPRFLAGAEDTAEQRLTELYAVGVTDVLAHNIGAVYLAHRLGMTVHAGFGLNISNSYALRFYAGYGVSDAEVSVELDRRRIDRLHSPIPIGVFTYGYMPLMVTRNAPAGAPLSCTKRAFLQDRKGERFEVRERKPAFEIYNCVPTIVPYENDNGEKPVFGVFHFSVDNSVENMEKTLRNLSSNQGFDRFTRGLYIKGVKKFTI